MAWRVADCARVDCTRIACAQSRPSMHILCLTVSRARGLSYACTRMRLCGIAELANEIALRGSASAHTRAKFAQWLRRQYAGRLRDLNGRWQRGQAASGLAFGSFEEAADAATPPGRASPATAEPEGGSGRAAQLADWFRFNDERVSAWQRALAEMVWEVAPCYATMAKLNQANTIDERLSDHGIDTTALVRLHNVSAYDSGFGYPLGDGESDAFKSKTSRYRTSSYSSDWLNQAIVVPFLRTTAPSKLLLDTELHTFSAFKWRHPVTSEATARVAYARNLISAALGRAGQITWLWGRNQNGVGLAPTCKPTLNMMGQPSGFTTADCNKQGAHRRPEPAPT